MCTVLLQLKTRTLLSKFSRHLSLCSRTVTGAAHCRARYNVEVIQYFCSATFNFVTILQCISLFCMTSSHCRHSGPFWQSLSPRTVQRTAQFLAPHAAVLTSWLYLHLSAPLHACMSTGGSFFETASPKQLQWHMCRYVSGDFRFRAGYCRRNPRKMVKMWAEKEFRNLNRLYQAGIPCPKPILLRQHVLVMSFIGESGVAAPRLKVSLLHTYTYMHTGLAVNANAMLSSHTTCIMLVVLKSTLIHDTTR